MKLIDILIIVQLFITILLVYIVFIRTIKKERKLKNIYKVALLILRDHCDANEQYEHAQEIDEIIKKISKE